MKQKNSVLGILMLLSLLLLLFFPFSKVKMEEHFRELSPRLAEGTEAEFCGDFSAGDAGLAYENFYRGSAMTFRIEGSEEEGYTLMRTIPDYTAAADYAGAVLRGAFWLAVSGLAVSLLSVLFRLKKQSGLGYNEVRLAAVSADALLVLSAVTVGGSLLVTHFWGCRTGISVCASPFAWAAAVLALILRLLLALWCHPEKIPFSETSFSALLPALFLGVGEYLVSACFSGIGAELYDVRFYREKVPDFLMISAMLLSVLLLSRRNRNRKNRIAAGVTVTVFTALLSVLVYNIRTGGGMKAYAVAGDTGAGISLLFCPAAMICACLAYRKRSLLFGGGFALAAAGCDIAVFAMEKHSSSAQMTEDCIAALLITRILLLIAAILLLLLRRNGEEEEYAAGAGEAAHG